MKQKDEIVGTVKVIERNSKERRIKCQCLECDFVFISSLSSFYHYRQFTEFRRYPLCPRCQKRKKKAEHDAHWKSSQSYYKMRDLKRKLWLQKAADIHNGNAL